MAREFHKKGLRVFATARKAASLTDLAALDIETFSLEVTQPASISALADEITALTAGRGLDYLVNNAGRNYTVPALDVDFDEVQTTYETNVFAVMRMCQSFSSLLIQARGTIVQIGSITGVTPYVFGSVYNSTKAALASYSDTLRVELAPFDVRVITVVTGGVQSNIARTDRALPPGSLYLPVNEEYLRRVKHSQEGAMPNAAYAASVVRQVLADRNSLLARLGLRTRTRSIWEGNKSWLIWMVYWLFPQGSFVSVSPSREARLISC